MKYNKQALRFWTENKKVVHIIPPNSTTDFPEGWDVPACLKNIIGDESTVELGCGYGRLVSGFTPEQYKGFDINPSAIKKAQQNHPNHSFTTYQLGTELPPSDWVLFYTVLLHISDEDIGPLLDLSTKNCDNIIIAEIMFHGSRLPPKRGKPPVWNRKETEYVALLEGVGFDLTSSVKKPWRGVENRISVLTFKRK